jgi:hypothetical protein
MQKLILQWVNHEGKPTTGPRDRTLWHITYGGVTSLSYSSYKTVLKNLVEGTYTPNQVRRIARQITWYTHRYNLSVEAFRTEAVLTDVDIQRLREVFEYHADQGNCLVAKSVERYII